MQPSTIGIQLHHVAHLQNDVLWILPTIFNKLSGMMGGSRKAAVACITASFGAKIPQVSPNGHPQDHGWVKGCVGTRVSAVLLPWEGINTTFISWGFHHSSFCLGGDQRISISCL